MTQQKKDTRILVETSVALAVENEYGQAETLAAGQRALIDPDDPAIRGLLGVFVHEVRDAD